MEDLPEHEAKGIRQYVDSQVNDKSNPAELVQRVGSRRVSGQSYEIYDVWLRNEERWWVITNPTNLYSQEKFKKIDEVFSFHLGIMVQLHDRSRREMMGDDGDRVTGAWRRFAKAVEAMNDAQEAEDFQAVGIRCREALLAHVRETAESEWLTESGEKPKLADFKGWMDLHAEALLSSRPRRYFKALAEKVWDLTVWLQHFADATEWDAEMVLDATAHFLNTFSLSVLRFDSGESRRCPGCGSYRVTQDGELQETKDQIGWWSQDVCSACGWRGAENFEPFTADHLQRLSDYAEMPDVDTT